MSSAEPSSHGHTPPEPDHAVSPGVGSRLAAWTLEVMAGNVTTPAGLDADATRSFRRIVTAVEAVQSEGVQSEGVSS